MFFGGRIGSRRAMLRVEVRHNGFIRPCRQMRVDIGPADTQETADDACGQMSRTNFHDPIDAPDVCISRKYFTDCTFSSQNPKNMPLKINARLQHLSLR